MRNVSKAEHPHGSLPAISLRRDDAGAARAILAGVPRPDDRWASGYPAEGDREAASLALRIDEPPRRHRRSVATRSCARTRTPSSEGLVPRPSGHCWAPSRSDTASPTRSATAATRRRRSTRWSRSRTAARGCQVTARTDPANGPSRRALERCGFTTVSIDQEYVHHVLECPGPASGADDLGDASIVSDEAGPVGETPACEQTPGGADERDRLDLLRFERAGRSTRQHLEHPSGGTTRPLDHDRVPAGRTRPVDRAPRDDRPGRRLRRAVTVAQPRARASKRLATSGLATALRREPPRRSRHARDEVESKERRLAGKRQRSATKSGRQRPSPED